VASVQDVPLEVVGALVGSIPVERFLEQYESALPEKVRRKRRR